MNLTRWFVISLFVYTAKIWGAFPSLPGQDPWESRPNDPGYQNAWQLFSHVPKNHTGQLTPFEREAGSGMGVDKAWQYHTGTPGTLIAVLDSGIYWDDEDLRERLYLNAGELPLPLGSSSYDKNGDGRFSISDYSDDTRVKDLNHNQRLDIEDLILTFSDKVDQDGNGYVDDIAGWDFHEHDNNPYDRTRFGHGTGEAHDSASALNNGIGDAGVCGNCSVMPLRVNDSFVVDTNAFAAAVFYAARQGTKVIQEALGSVNQNPYTQAALEFAYQKGVIVIGSAADECSFHHNYPATLEPVIYTNAIRYDTPDFTKATTFVNFNNCSNLGARVDIAVPALHCSSEATGLLAGVAGLAASFANEKKLNLTTGELISLLTTTTTDINLGPAIPGDGRYGTYAGWDSTTGFGRANASRLIEKIALADVPPSVRILTPEWFAPVDMGRAKSIPITVASGTRQSGLFKLTLKIFRGVETEGAVAKVLREEQFRGPSYAGEFYKLSFDTLAELSANRFDPPREKYSYTLILRAEDAKGRVAEARRTFFAFTDPSLVTGFPAKLPGSGESGGFFMDLNGDGRDEYVTADGAGWIHALTLNGSEIKGFPAASVKSRYHQEAQSSIIAPIAGGDLDGDGKPEIVAVSLEGHITVINHDGSSHAGFPVTLPFPKMEEASPDQTIAQGVYATPVITDLDGDGKQEIVVVALDGFVHAYRANGEIQKGYPVAIERKGKRAKILSSPAAYDINQDGKTDLIFGTNHTAGNTGFLFALDGRGNLASELMLPGFPVEIPLIRDALLPTIGVGIPTSPAVADLNNDGTPEIVIHPFVGKTHVVSLEGKIATDLSMKVSSTHQTNDTFMVSAFGNPAIGKLNNSPAWNPVSLGVGKKMLVTIALGGKRGEHQFMVGAWNPEGPMLESYPRQIDDMTLSPAPALVDLNGDGLDEVIVGSGGYFVHAYSAKGEANGFPHFTGGWTYSSVSVGDMDGDGVLEVGVSTREGYVFIWKTAGKVPEKKSWDTFKANTQRTGYRPR